MKYLQKQLLQKLIALRPEILDVTDLTHRRHLLSNAFTTVSDNYKGSIAINFNHHIDRILAASDYNIDNLISFLKETIDSPFDDLTMNDGEGDNFDNRFGTETNLIYEQLEMPEEISEDRMKLSSRFHPTPIRTFRYILNTLKGHIVDFDHWTFIDIGSGLGRNLLLAAEHSFKRIIGIEISPFLHNKAVANIENYNQKAERRCNIEVLCMNALDYNFPETDTILYFWEPFREITVMEKLMRILEKISGKYRNRFILIFLGHCYLDTIPSLRFQKMDLRLDPQPSTSGKLFAISFYVSCHV
jgi:SAM-dependent methyltransferase